MGWNPFKDIENGVKQVGDTVKSISGNLVQGVGAVLGVQQPKSQAPQQSSPWSMPQAPQAVTQAPNANAYPAMPNDYGLGATEEQPPTQGTADAPNYLQEPLTVTMQDSSSRGFNPWSLLGESNARGPS